jgi:putative ABC transport system permease protein
MNIMLMAVTERTREIGIRKALGARRSDILSQFVVESATLSTLGAGIGIATGIGLAFLVRALTPLPAAVATWSLVVGVCVGLGVGMVAGVYPAYRAAKLDPIVALRAECYVASDSRSAAWAKAWESPSIRSGATRCGPASPSSGSPSASWW